MRYSILILTLFFSFSAKAQDTVLTYYDDEWEETISEDYVYYRKGFEGKDSLWFVKDYYRNGQIQMTGSFKSSATTTKHGQFTYYHENGNVSIYRVYIDGMIRDTNIRYYENGKLKLYSCSIPGTDLDTLVKGNEDGVITERSTKKDGFKHGRTIYYHDNGEKAAYGDYERGDKVGTWKYFNEEGELTGTEKQLSSLRTPCGCKIKLPGTKWINTNPEEHGKKEKGITVDAFYRRSTYSETYSRVSFHFSAMCMFTYLQGESKDIAKSMMKFRKYKGKPVTKWNGEPIELHGGALYKYTRTIDGEKSLHYLYVLKGGATTLQLFFDMDEDIKDENHEEVFEIIESLSCR